MAEIASHPVRRFVLAVAVSAVAASGCGDDHASPVVRIRGLPVQQGLLIADLCQGPGEPHDRRDRVVKARAQRGLRVLLRALRTRPQARVRTVYYEEGGLFTEGGRKTEVLSVRDLARNQAYADHDLEVVLSATGARASCVVPLRSRLLRAARQ